MGPGEHEHVVPAREFPRKDYLLIAHTMHSSNPAEGVELGSIIRLAETAQRAPANESQPKLGSAVNSILGIAVNRRKLVLHRYQGIAQYPMRNTDLFNACIGYPYRSGNPWS